MAHCRVTLADLRNVPDTSLLQPCSDADTAAHIESVRARLLRRHRMLVERGSCSASAASRRGHEQIVAALRRLQNPQLGAFHKGTNTIVLSEPFKGVPSAIRPAPLRAARKHVAAMAGVPPPTALVRALAAFGESALVAAERAGVKIGIMEPCQSFADLSPAVARCLPGVDGWPAPPAGLFVVEERRLLLRGEAMRMTAAHEFAHALDAVLAAGERSYFSFESAELRHYFSTATGFINEYAASGLDEYFAESVRAYVEINDPLCTWLPLTRRDLLSKDPRLFALIERIFLADFNVGAAALRRRAS